LAWVTALALSVAWAIAPRAYSSWTASVRSALSIEILVKREAASTAALVISDIGLAFVAMESSGRSSQRGIVRRNNSILGSAAGPCQGFFGAMHQAVSIAVQ